MLPSPQALSVTRLQELCQHIKRMSNGKKYFRENEREKGKEKKREKERAIDLSFEFEFQ